MGHALRILWEYSEHALCVFWEYLGNALEYSENTRVHSMRAAWEYHGNIVGIPWQVTGGNNFVMAWAAMEYHYGNTLIIMWECCGDTQELLV